MGNVSFNPKLPAERTLSRIWDIGTTGKGGAFLLPPLRVVGVMVVRGDPKGNIQWPIPAVPKSLKINSKARLFLAYTSN